VYVYIYIELTSRAFTRVRQPSFKIEPGSMDRPNHASNSCSICLAMSAADDRAHLRSPGQPLALPTACTYSPTGTRAHSRDHGVPTRPHPRQRLPLPCRRHRRLSSLDLKRGCEAIGAAPWLPCRVQGSRPGRSMARAKSIPPSAAKAKSPRKMKAVSVYTVGLRRYSGSCSFLTHRFRPTTTMNWQHKS
jgi:hypothetical protein